MSPIHFVIIQRAGTFEIWESCSDKECILFHRLVAEAKDSLDAERIVRSLTPKADPS